MSERERDLLKRTAELFPSLSQSDVARVALLRGLELIERDGITLPPRATE